MSVLSFSLSLSHSSLNNPRIIIISKKKVELKKKYIYIYIINNIIPSKFSVCRFIIEISSWIIPRKLKARIFIWSIGSGPIYVVWTDPHLTDQLFHNDQLSSLRNSANNSACKNRGARDALNRSVARVDFQRSQLKPFPKRENDFTFRWKLYRCISGKPKTWTWLSWP